MQRWILILRHAPYTLLKSLELGRGPSRCPIYEILKMWSPENMAMINSAMTFTGLPRNSYVSTGKEDYLEALIEI